jgi:hypothetical protein
LKMFERLTGVVEKKGETGGPEKKDAAIQVE